MSENPSSKTYFDEHQRIVDLKNFKNVQSKEKKRHFTKKLMIFMFVLILGVGLWYGLRANQAMEKISIEEGSFLERVIRLLPIDKSFLVKLPIEKSVFEEPNTQEKLVNYLILGMRGADDLKNGGLLADSSIVVSVRPYDNKVALISVPRDLYVEMPGLDKKHKLNEAYELGEKRNSGKGLDYAKSIFSNITGIPIHYAVIVNFQAFKDLVDSVGGVELNLDKPFSEAVPFEEGTISLPAGKQTIDGKTALLYARARFSSSDFDRSRRQQEIIKNVYAKLDKTGILLNPYRLDKLLKIVENNTRTDMKVWEIEETVKLFAGLKSPGIVTKVIDSGPEKLLYSTYSDEGAFILLPTNGNYDKIHEVIKNIFDQNSASSKAPHKIENKDIRAAK